MKTELAAIRDFFLRSTKQGIDLKQPMPWSYFFIAWNETDLPAYEQLASSLEPRGYRHVDDYQAEDGTFWFRAEKVEQLDAERLDAICNEMHELADALGVEFDGFGMGNIDGSVLR